MTDFTWMKDFYQHVDQTVRTYQAIKEDWLETLFNTDWDYVLQREQPDLIKDIHTFRNSIVWC